MSIAFYVFRPSGKSRDCSFFIVAENALDNPGIVVRFSTGALNSVYSKF